MSKNKQKLKKEKGATGLDIGTGAFVFILFTTVILTLYLQIYKQSSIIKIHENAMGYIIEICEDIDMRDYGELEDINEYKERIIAQINLPEDKYNLVLTQEKYIDTHTDAQDLVKRMKINITYNFDGQETSIEVNKIKVKE